MFIKVFCLFFFFHTQVFGTASEKIIVLIYVLIKKNGFGDSVSF